MTISRMQEPRQLYGLGSFVKKITKPIKKIVKSPIGKAALGAAALYGVNRFGVPGTGGFGQGAISRLLAGRATNPAGPGSTGGLGALIKRIAGGAAKGFGNLSFGQKAFLGGGAADDFEVEEDIEGDPTVRHQPQFEMTLDECKAFLRRDRELERARAPGRHKEAVSNAPSPAQGCRDLPRCPRLGS